MLKIIIESEKQGESTLSIQGTTNKSNLLEVMIVALFQIAKKCDIPTHLVMGAILNYSMYDDPVTENEVTDEQIKEFIERNS